MNLSGTMFHTSKFYFETANRIAQPAYTTFDARAAWTLDGTGFTFSVYGRNLTDKATIQGLFATEIADGVSRSEEHTSELQSLMRISYAVFCLKKKKTKIHLD